MTNFEVDVKKPAARQVERLSPAVAQRILSGLRAPAANPYPRGDTIKPLKGHANLYRLRIGDWRVVYELAGRKVQVLYVAKRDEVYKRACL